MSPTSGYNNPFHERYPVNSFREATEASSLCFLSQETETTNPTYYNSDLGHL